MAMTLKKLAELVVLERYKANSKYETLVDLAEKTGISTVTLGNLVHNKTKYLQSTTLKKLADFLEIKLTLEDINH